MEMAVRERCPPQVENKGTVPFDFNTAVNVASFTPATNVYGQQFWLQDYLKFGLVAADSEQEMMALVATRQMALDVCTMPLNNYSTNATRLDPGESKYIAVVVCMPETVGNEANYRGDVVPQVELGIIVSATQVTQ